MTTELERSLEDEMDRSMSQPTPRPVIFSPKAPPEMSLTDQLAKVEAINISLREKTQRQRIEMAQEQDRRWQEIRQEYQTKTYNEITRLEQERDKKLRLLADEYHQKNRELDHLIARLERI